MAVIGLICTGLVTVNLVSAQTSTLANTITVGAGMQYSSIQAAVNAAGAGYTVTVYSGTYRENVAISKQITLKGVDNGGGRPVIDGMSNGANTVNIRANGVTIDGFTIKNGYSGIDISSASYATVRNCQVTGNSNHGLYLQYSYGNLIESNDVSGNAQSSVEGDTKNAITLYESDGNRINANTITNNGGTVARDGGAHVYHLGDGVSLLWSDNNVVTNNVMNDDHYAVWIFHSTNATVTGNKASGMYYDITIEYGSNSLVADNTLSNGGRNLKIHQYSSGNTIRNNVMSGGIYGITLDDSWYNTLEGNTLSSSTYNDMVLTNASYNTLIENKISNCGSGPIITNSVGNTIYLNDFLNGIYTASSGNTWNSPRAISYNYNGKAYNGNLGNRYSDYSGSDSTGDGVGSPAYTLDGVSDSYPLMQTHDKYVGPAATPTATPTTTPTPTPVATATATPTVTPSKIPTATPIATAKPTTSPIVTATPTTTPTTSPSKVLTVGQGKQYSTIQAAVNAAGAGYTVMVYSGTYTENVAIDRQLTLLGVDNGGGKPVIDGRLNGANSVNIRAGGVVVDSFVIKNGYSGIDVSGVGGAIIRNCKVTGNTNHGIYLQNSNNNLISGNDVSGNALNSIEGDTKNAITLYQSTGNHISGNTLSNNGGTISTDGSHVYHLGDGVSLLWSDNNVVTNNVMNDDHYAVWIFHSTNATVTGNKASGMYYDITIEYGSNSLVADNTLSNGGRNVRVCSYSTGNTIRGNTMSGGIYGITLDDSWYNTIEGNTVSGSTYNDMMLTNASYNTITQNRLSNSGAGLQLTNSVGNTLYLNDFLDGIYSADQGNTWYSQRTIVYAYNGKSSSSRLGNRYVDYTGQDKNGDGIGTQKYNKNGIRDNYPLTDTHEKYTLK